MSWIDEDQTPYLPAEKVAYIEIKTRVLDGRLRPGDRLLLRGLAAELGVSQVPVLMALRMLERDGFVVNMPGRGSCVRTWNREEIIDLYNTRAVLEGLAARLCSERATRDEVQAITAANEVFVTASERMDIEAQTQADMDFHVSLVRGAHAPDLRRLTNNGSIIECSIRQFGISLNVPQVVRPEYKLTHVPILDAIIARDPVAAEKAGRDHVEASLARNLSWIAEIAAAMQR